MKRNKEFPDKKLEIKVAKALSKTRLLEIESGLNIFKDNIEMLYSLRYEAIVFTYGTDYFVEKFQALIEKIEKAILKVM